MKTAKLFSLLLCAALVWGLCACGAAPADTPAEVAPVSDSGSAPESGPVTLTDMMGREVTLSAPVERIVALTAADCEIVCALGAEELLVGRGEYCDYPASVQALPSVQSGAETNVEQILALRPQAVFMAGMEQSPEQIAQLEAAGVAVIESDAHTVEETYAAIAMIGAALNRGSEAEELIDSMKSTFAALAAAGEGAGSVYFEVSPLEWGLWTAGTGTFMDEVAAMLGLTNCFGDVEGWAAISEEQVLERCPDYIVTISMYYGEGPTPVEEILSRPGWENVPAVKNSAILNLTGDELSRPGPRLADGAQQLADFLASCAADKAA